MRREPNFYIIVETDTSSEAKVIKAENLMQIRIYYLDKSTPLRISRKYAIINIKYGEGMFNPSIEVVRREAGTD